MPGAGNESELGGKVCGSAPACCCKVAGVLRGWAMAVTPAWRLDGVSAPSTAAV